jgi:hypothetical protein
MPSDFFNNSIPGVRSHELPARTFTPPTFVYAQSSSE